MQASTSWPRVDGFQLQAKLLVLGKVRVDRTAARVVHCSDVNFVSKLVFALHEYSKHVSTDSCVSIDGDAQDMTTS